MNYGSVVQLVELFHILFQSTIQSISSEHCISGFEEIKVTGIMIHSDCLAQSSINLLC